MSFELGALSFVLGCFGLLWLGGLFHSHRGFSPVIALAAIVFNRFNGF